MRCREHERAAARPAVLPRRHVRLGCQQHLNARSVSPKARHHQRCAAVGPCLVRRDAVAEQQGDAAVVAVKGRPEQRRPARLVSLGDRGACAQEVARRRRIAVHACVRERRQPIPPRLVGQRLSVEQQPHGVGVAVSLEWRAVLGALRGIDQHRRAVRLHHVKLGPVVIAQRRARVEEPPRALGVAIDAGELERCEHYGVAVVHAEGRRRAANLEQQAGRLHVVAFACDHQRRPAVGVGGVGVGAGTQQATKAAVMSPFRSDVHGTEAIVGPSQLKE